MCILSFGVIQCINVTPSATPGEVSIEEKPIVLETPEPKESIDNELDDTAILGSEITTIYQQSAAQTVAQTSSSNSRSSGQTYNPVTPRTYARNDNDIAYIANILASECYISERGDMINVGMTICNRVDSDKFPNSVYGVVTQKGQMAYNPNRYVAPEYYDAATEVYNTWMDRQNGEDVNWNDNYLFWGAGGGTTNVFRHDY